MKSYAFTMSTIGGMTIMSIVTKTIPHKRISREVSVILGGSDGFESISDIGLFRKPKEFNGTNKTLSYSDECDLTQTSGALGILMM